MLSIIERAVAISSSTFFLKGAYNITVMNLKTSNRSQDTQYRLSSLRHSRPLPEFGAHAVVGSRVSQSADIVL